MSKDKLFVIGDSVVWGQGLAHEHKTAAILARHLGAEIQMMAHSGAKIGIRDPDRHYAVRRGPRFFPRSCSGFTGDPG
jgi:hypothetical protein